MNWVISTCPYPTNDSIDRGTSASVISLSVLLLVNNREQLRQEKSCISEVEQFEYSRHSSQF